MKLIVGCKYQFKYETYKIVYAGKDGSWHQFELDGEAGVIWCELLDSDLHLIESAGGEQ